MFMQLIILFELSFTSFQLRLGNWFYDHSWPQFYALKRWLGGFTGLTASTNAVAANIKHGGTAMVPLTSHMQMQHRTKDNYIYSWLPKKHLLRLLDVTLLIPRQYGCLPFLMSSRTSVYSQALWFCFLAIFDHKEDLRAQLLLYL